MSVEVHRNGPEQEEAPSNEGTVVKKSGVFSSVFRGLFWPFGVVVRAYRGFLWVLGFRGPQDETVITSPGRQNLAGRKRLHRVTRLLLAVLPQWLQSALGYPVSSTIGRSLSPEMRISPTKPCGKGSKRKQDELDEDEDDYDEEAEHPTWVDALTQELADDDAPEEDPDYEPSTVETESEEYRSHNNTESDIEIQEKSLVVIQDVNTMAVLLLKCSQMNRYRHNSGSGVNC
ncbi:hypothetical protein fugu_005598 [Takifugu bimaculatus]|uniref:Oogenesis-related gene n=1 Tax=Takifugu bimaculatus TaxID=433685 RepID=A0A4Z2B5G1_9TELE|nr:hypothetical protein fugu_005598 [Takifugu bimaculatus]